LLHGQFRQNDWGRSNLCRLANLRRELLPVRLPGPRGGAV
jgi:hypothetical protein